MPEVVVLSEVSMFEEGEALLRCSRKALTVLKAYSASKNTNPPLFVAGKFVGIPVVVDASVDVNTLIIEPCGSKLLWWVDEKKDKEIQ